MKIIRYFIQHQSEESGMDGFVPLWIPKSSNFDPFGAQGMAHDMLEHRLCDKGAYFEELMAFGRAAALRGIPRHTFRSTLYTPSESLGTELAGIWARVQSDNRADLPAAPETGRVSDHAEDFLRNMVRNFAKSVERECEDNDAEFAIDRTHIRSMLSWLRIGYLDALRRYGEQDHGCYDTGWAAFHWADCNKKRINSIGEEALGCVMRLCFDTDRREMRDTLIEPNRKYGIFQGWLESRIRAWRMS